MKVCKNCSSVMSDEDLFCTNCGTKVEVAQNPAYDQGRNFSGNVSQAPVGTSGIKVNYEPKRNDLSLSDFYRLYAPDKIKKNVRNIMILGLIFAAVNLILCMAAENIFGLIDVAAIAGFSLWFYSRPEKLQAYCLLGYTALSILIGLILSGTFTGWLLLIWSIGAIKTAAEVEKEYAEFIKKGC